MVRPGFTLTDADRDAIKSGVSCALLLEQHGYALDKRESTRACLKYRRAAGEIIIVNHEGRGWWDTGSQEKGDVFALARRLLPDTGFRQVCVALGGLVGVQPDGAVYVRERAAADETVEPPPARWARKRTLRRGSQVWDYLTRERCLPDWVVRRAITLDCVRDGYKAAWFAHRDPQGQVCGAELRGPDTHLCIKASTKTLFRFQPHAGTVTRLVVCEAAIDALSFAALDDDRTNGSLYTSTGGGLGPETIEALRTHLREMASLPDAILVIATDDDDAGDRYADTLCDLACDEGVEVMRRLPPDRAKDFNQTLKNRAALGVPTGDRNHAE